MLSSECHIIDIGLNFEQLLRFRTTRFIIDSPFRRLVGDHFIVAFDFFLLLFGSNDPVTQTIF